MRFVTFTRKNERRLGLMSPQDQILDLAEINRRYLKNGNASCLTSMQAFIEGGSKAFHIARQAEKYVSAKNIEDQKKLFAAGALLKSNQVKIVAPIPVPRKNVVMLGVNYREHVDEGAKARSLEIKYPDYFLPSLPPASSGSLAK
jgi:2-keto-4-pentenoate hydratase/2-oxohepta-3-ene-1,7-dioic acid hydratase in catechol pathway